MPTLVLKHISKEYPTRAEPLRVLDDISFELPAASAIAIVGPSGSGKSTLLSIIGTLETPTTGQVLLDDIDPFQLSEPELAAFRNQRVGFVFQDHLLLPQCGALENVLIPCLASGTTTDEDRARGKALLEQVGLAERMQHRPAELSGGERQRVAIARALIRSPDLLLADEPTGNLDRQTAETIGDVLTQMHAECGVTLIVVTHSTALAQRLPRQFELENALLIER